MNKSELIDAIATESGLSKIDAKKSLDATLKAISDAMKNGESLALIGFGTFSVSQKPARTGVNPRTKEKIQIAAKNVVKFKAGSALNDLIK